jgi:hypothetical protein
MLKLPHVTLLAVSSIKIPETIYALQKSCKDIEFAEVKIITDIKPDNLPSNITFEQSPKLSCIDDYNQYVFSELWRHVNTSHCLVQQYDSYVIRPWLWDNEWLLTDYLGAPWAIRENSYIADNGERVRVGNGGFSLRSSFLLNAPKNLGLQLKQEQSYFSEDGNINCYHRSVLLNYGIRYGSLEQAIDFSFETWIPENNLRPSFGFHKYVQLMEGENIEQFR